MSQQYNFFVNSRLRPRGRNRPGHTFKSCFLENDKGYRIKASAESVLSDIYTFQDKVLRVIDGETLLTDVDLGFIVY